MLAVKPGDIPMIKDVMVRVDGSAADDARLAAAKNLAGVFDGQLIALFINVLPRIIPEEASVVDSVGIVTHAREAGDLVEAKLNNRLSQIHNQFELRRFDVFGDVIADIAAREARSADAFVALRPNGSDNDEPSRVVEGVLFGSGRHLLLVPSDKSDRPGFDDIVVAWNGSRESARALAESLPYLHRAEQVSVVTVIENQVEDEAILGEDAVHHLAHHGIQASLRHVAVENGDVADTLLGEAHRGGADLIVLGGYGHSRVREWLLGGVTHKLLHHSTVPLLLAH
jgi:nucleotide-binding universal stress UspA family protein